MQSYQKALNCRCRVMESYSTYKTKYISWEWPTKKVKKNKQQQREWIPMKNESLCLWGERDWSWSLGDVLAGFVLLWNRAAVVIVIDVVAVVYHRQASIDSTTKSFNVTQKCLKCKANTPYFFSSPYWSNATAEMVLCGAARCLMTNGICILDKTMMYWRDWSERRMYSTTMTSARQESENQRKRENLHSILKSARSFTFIINLFIVWSHHESTWQWIVSLASSPDPIDCGQQRRRETLSTIQWREKFAHIFDEPLHQFRIS